MPSATELIGPGGFGLLRASDLPTNVRQFTVVFTAVEHLDNLASPLIAHVEEEVVPGRGTIPLNKTNIRALVDFLGDDYSQWAGATVTFSKVPVNNPQTGAPGWGLRVTDAYFDRKKK